MDFQGTPVRESFLTELSIAGRKMRTMFDALVRERGLTLPRARLLLHLASGRTVIQSELATLLELEPPTLVRLLDGLERQGLVRRLSVEGDRRAKQVVLTEEAAEQVAELERIIAQMRRILLRDIPDADIVAAAGVLDRLIHNIERQSREVSAEAEVAPSNGGEPGAAP